MRRSLLAFALAGLVLPASAKAQEWDTQSYWNGFTLGSAYTVCELLKLGRLSRDDTKDWLKGLFEKSDKVPDLAVVKAFDTVRGNKQYDYCPLPRSR